MENKMYENSKKKYEYWREEQRKQLGNSANIYLGFATAILYFNITQLLKPVEIAGCIKTILIIACIFLFLSILSYSILIYNRLIDFRKTAGLFKDGKSDEQVRNETYLIGKLTWTLYNLQLLFLWLGLIFSLLGVSFLIFE